MKKTYKAIFEVHGEVFSANFKADYDGSAIRWASRGLRGPKCLLAIFRTKVKHRSVRLVYAVPAHELRHRK